MSASDKVKALTNLTDRESFRVEAVKEVRAQVGRDGAYAVPFDGVGKGFSPARIGTLVALFSSDPFELYRLVTVLMDQDETGQVREAVAADLIE
ncbi:hypothetical protein [Streptomyces caniscabiei]|uniref:hypothetical protein n=1 Tax=Streptomyces caniscabiei TaxID=2746961 RepID=UPI001872CAAF|nr:hypothetical protein [Streptomyces caniscabiei]MBE4761339.1 hypothetical protein [Streptomyces caniscabiei]